uniref:Efflux RND transporter periplasmic adaptor subunit n=1 Tax=Candidatus Desulfatibia profunda TaxID=2841695 RepID=A0A8J6NT84_9BACT|nr:efflux RND transporter periplasmic adaptor subunit [Candidatus Desulfatibia profunda]
MPDDDLLKLRIDRTTTFSRRVQKKRYVALGIALLILSAAGVLYQQGLLAPAVDVQVTTVQNIYPSQAVTLLNASSYVVAQRKAAVASKLTGRLVFLAVEEGNRVQKGQVIARLENDDALAARDKARANVKLAGFNLQYAGAELEDASRVYERNRALVAKRSISQSEFDAVEARYLKAQAVVAAQQAALQVSEAALKEANLMVDYAYIRAPFDAVVLTKNADIGDIVTPLGAAANAKAAVVTIADMDSLQTEADVSESNIEQVKAGQPCEIQLDALPDERFQGAVHMIVPTADRSKASILVKVNFLDKDPRILPEMSAKVAFLSRALSPEEQKPVKAVLTAAVADRNGQKVVFVVRGERAVKTPVRIGKTYGDMAEVFGTVDVGSKVVFSPLNKIKDNTRIKTPEK